MSFLYPLFKKLSDLPIGDPHAGYEGELLACGAKPIGFMTECFRADTGQPIQYVRPTPAYMMRQAEQIKIADAAAARGDIVKLLVETEMYPEMWPNQKIQGHFYSQPQFVDDMKELAAGYKEYWVTGKFPELSRPIGYFIGCTDADFAHPDEDTLAGKFLWKARPILRYCRAQALKHEAENGTIKLRTKPACP